MADSRRPSAPGGYVGFYPRGLVGADWLAIAERTSHMPTSKTYEPHAGRVALVTGTSRGIGQAIAVGLAERGARVVLGDRGDASETIALIADGGHEAVPVRLDVSDPSSIEAARDRVAEQLGHVDILVNNAGTFRGCDLG